MMSSKDMENMGKAIEEIGTTKSCITAGVLKDVRKIVVEKGLDAAEIHAAQLSGTDQNTELSRVFEICRAQVEEHSYKLLEALGEQIAADVLSAFAAVARVTVTVRKPGVPIDGVLDHAGVRLERTRA